MDSTSKSGITDDQELAKVLESMNQQTSSPVVPPTTGEDTSTADDAKTSEDTPTESGIESTIAAEIASTEESTPATESEASDEPSVSPLTPIIAPLPTTSPEPIVPTSSAHGSPELEAIKKTALEELRPLVDKLDLPADEKFDTLLLLIRSTDDKTLVGAAHEAARSIDDETKRAQALLDVIKEIDYFSGHGQAPT